MMFPTVIPTAANADPVVVPVNDVVQPDAAEITDVIDDACVPTIADVGNVRIVLRHVEHVVVGRQYLDAIFISNHLLLRAKVVGQCARVLGRVPSTVGYQAMRAAPSPAQQTGGTNRHKQ